MPDFLLKCPGPFPPSAFLRTMKFRFSLFVGLAVVWPAAGLAQSVSKPSSADAAWLDLAARAAPGVVSRSAGPANSADQIKVAGLDYAERQKVAAQSAKDFYTAHPADARVPEAQKLEAASLLRSMWPLPDDRGQAALQAATAFVTDQRNATKDRFEVAALLFAQQHKIRTNGGALQDDAAAYEKTAEMMQREFGDIPEVFDYYLGVADASDPETGIRAARKIVQSTALARTQKQAQVVIDRYALIGLPLGVELADGRGRSVDLRRPGRPTVIYVWSAKHGENEWAALVRARRAVPENTQWIFVALDTTASEQAAVMTKIPVRGIHCLLNDGQRAAFAKELKVRRMPYAYVLGRSGALAGYGRPADLPELLTPLSR